MNESERFTRDNGGHAQESPPWKMVVSEAAFPIQKNPEGGRKVGGPPGARLAGLTGKEVKLLLTLTAYRSRIKIISRYQDIDIDIDQDIDQAFIFKDELPKVEEVGVAYSYPFTHSLFYY